MRDQLKCGNCGGKELHAFNRRPNSAGSREIVDLELECLGCGESTRIAHRTRVSLEPYPDNSGTICGGWR